MSSNRNPARRRIMRRILIVALTVFAGFLAASWLVAGWLVAPRPRSVGEPPEDLNATSFVVASESGSQISGWHTQPDSSDGVIVLLHGIRGSRLSMLDRARTLHAEGYSTVMIDLQAHGESPGQAITAGHLERYDVRAAVEFARREHPQEPIGVIGVSLGGAAALLASPLNIDALVIESVYPDIRDAVQNRVEARLGPLASIPASLLLLQLKPRLGVSPAELRPIEYVSRVACPIMIASGTADVHTTELETRAMFAAAAEPKQLWLVDGVAHKDLLHHQPLRYRDRIVSFLNDHLRTRRQRNDRTFDAEESTHQDISISNSVKESS